MIPDDAVEAGIAAWAKWPEGVSPQEQMASILEAAAPYLMAEATTEADLDSLPAGSVVMGFDAYGEQLVSRKSEHGTWEQAGTDDGWQADGIIREYETVTVLHLGKDPL